jgi:RND family efflux transporter MFP subunit
MEDAQSKYDSAEKLVKSGDISTQRFTEVEKQYRARQAGLDAVQDEVRAQLAQVQALKADLRLVEKRLSDTVVRAPFDGSVSAKHVSAGQYVKDNAPVVTLVKTWPLRLRTEIPESATAAAKVGATLTFTTDAVPGKEFHAVVRELNPVLDARTRTLIAEARLVESDQRLRAGAFVQVRLLTETGAQVTFVPKQALYQVAGLTKFFIIANGKAVERRFVPGVEEAGWVEVPGGLVAPGQQVAISALAALTDGAPVKPQAGRS